MPTRPPTHRPIGPRPGRTPTRQSSAFYRSVDWRKLRLAVLKRDGWRCQLLLPGCTGRAQAVDHVKAREDGGADDPANLRSTCLPCHNRRHPEKTTAPRDI
jgi:5-methylcytosine-specific restriction protein A